MEMTIFNSEVKKEAKEVWRKVYFEERNKEHYILGGGSYYIPVEEATERANKAAIEYIKLFDYEN